MISGWPPLDDAAFDADLSDGGGGVGDRFAESPSEAGVAATDRLQAAATPPHLPVRHTWVCTTCGDPWPCVSRRVQLVGEYVGATPSLALLMASALTEAMRDLPTVPAGVLHARFLGWIHGV